MFISKIVLACWLPLFFSGCSRSAHLNQHVLAYNDIDFITKTILENHPGPENTQDHDFMSILNTAYNEAIANAKKTSSEKEHLALLKKYIKHFNDGHLAFIETQRSNISKSMPKTSNVFLEEFMPGITWVSLPYHAFDPKNQAQVQQIQSIIDQMPKLRKDQLIIFDVRGNSGGNSAWCEKIIEALCGKDYALEKKNNLYANVYVDWRLSKGNFEHIKAQIDKYEKQFGEHSNQITYYTKLYKQLMDAFKAENVFSAEYYEPEPVQHDTQTSPQNKCHAEIIVLIDKGCGSTCLNFLDQLKALDHPVLFVGQTTNADTLYMDSRYVDLPSKLGKLQLPMKVYRNRKRGNNQPHHPDISYSGNINDTPTLTTWLKKNVIDQFLGRKLHK